MLTRVFAEHGVRVRRRFLPDGSAEGEVVRSRGVCVEDHLGDGLVEHRFADENVLPRTENVAGVLDLLGYTVPDDEDATLRDMAMATGAELTLGVRHQHVAAGEPERARREERLFRSLEVRLPGHAQVLVGSVDQARVEWAVHDVRERLALPRHAELPEHADLVLAPGRSGAFFHELVGHPLEADVAASGTSYLTVGHRVAPEWLSVVDSGRQASHGYRSAIDDEGTPCSPVRLIDRGVVGGHLTDLAIARRLGETSSGHGRRLSYRHPAIPRMTHTSAEIASSVELEPPCGDWITPYSMRLQMMNIATGDFVFRASFALLHKQDGVYRLGPFDVVGNGARVLAGLKPVDHRVGEYFRATGGCGKLGQFPLLVSFGNAGFRLPAGLVTLRAVHDA